MLLPVILFIIVKNVHPDNVGWKSYLKENPTEFHDIPLVWEEECSGVVIWNLC